MTDEDRSILERRMAYDLAGHGKVVPKSKALETQVGGDHYKNLPIQPIIFCERNKLTACESSVVKYVCRHRSKHGRKDLEKAIHYLQILIEEEYPEEK